MFWAFWVNAYRNQIDYIITNSIHQNLFLDLRSHDNLSTITDHKLVKAKINLEWWRLKRQFKKSERLDVNRLRDPKMSQKYCKDLHTMLEVERQENERPDTTWKRIAKACKETARNTVGIKEFSKTQSSSLIVQELSLIQKKLKANKELNQNKEQRRELNIDRNKTLKQLKKEQWNDNDKQLDLELQDIKKYKDGSNKCYEAIRKIQSHKPRKPLVIFDSELNRITSAEDQVTVITDHFTNLFSSEDKPVSVPPVKMEPEYNAEEIDTAAKKLKNNKAADRDEVKAELIKYGCRELYKQIASLLSVTSETGDYPEEVRRGILTPFAKSPKKDERVNVRPIILLSVLRKIITITLIDRY